MIVRCGSNCFAIPQTSISELVRIKANEAAIEDRTRQAGRGLPPARKAAALVRLDTALGIKHEDRQDKQTPCTSSSSRPDTCSTD